MNQSALFLMAALSLGFGANVASAGIPTAKAGTTEITSCTTAKECACNNGFNANCVNAQCTCSADADLRAEAKSFDRTTASVKSVKEKSRNVSMDGGTHAHSGGAQHQQN